MRELDLVEAESAQRLRDLVGDLTYLEPTPTGLMKSILDATGPVREYLKIFGFHDYELQGQGRGAKVIHPAIIAASEHLIFTTVSLYRPETKQGDPRLWISKLPAHARPNDALALFVFDGYLCVVNLSRTSASEIRKAPWPPERTRDCGNLAELLALVARTLEEPADELLRMLRDLASSGFVRAVGTGDTAIGRTLEAHLNIPMNASKAPDYKGIELKSARRKTKGAKNRVNLFAQVPDWKVSKLKSSAEVLRNFGYVRDPKYRRQLNCTVEAGSENSQGLRLRVDESTDTVNEDCVSKGIVGACVWPLPLLRARFAEKHAETFWVKAAAKIINGVEHFHFQEVQHTKGPYVFELGPAIRDSKITLDHLLTEDLLGRVVEKGPLFKISPSDLAGLFPPARYYSLVGRARLLP